MLEVGRCDGHYHHCRHRRKKGSTICPTSEIVCLPVLIFAYSHVENALFFALDLVVFLQLELLFQTYQLVVLMDSWLHDP